MMRIAYQGEPGAYSEAAALVFAPGAEAVPCRSFDEVFAAVSEGRVTRGIVPMENSIGGSIHRNYDLLVEHELPIVGEVELPVDHCLLARAGTRSRMSGRLFASAGAGAVRALPRTDDRRRDRRCLRHRRRRQDGGGGGPRRRGRRRVAARGGGVRARHRSKSRSRTSPPTSRASSSLRRSAAPAEDATKTSIVFALKSTPGSLHKALSGFALRDINMTKLESRPMRGRAWEYLFYVDVEVSRESLACSRAIVHLSEFAQWVRTLGSYRAWDRAAEPTPRRRAVDGPEKRHHRAELRADLFDPMLPLAARESR